MNIMRISAFSDGQNGGNPAGVLVSDELPSVEEMQNVARDVGYSESVFSAKQADGKWLTRYYSPESEVPFCGHATIALGAVLAEKFGADTYALKLRDAEITVEGEADGDLYNSALQSPNTKHRPLSDSELNATLKLLGYSLDDLDGKIPPARIHGGADHYVIALNSCEKLAHMNYNLNEGRKFMNAAGLITIMLVWAETDDLFHVRNAFASGGVLEDPATGAAAAAFSGYLRDSGLHKAGEINIVQGEDMGLRSRINASFSEEIGSSIRISGTARKINE